VGAGEEEEWGLGVAAWDGVAVGGRRAVHQAVAMLRALNTVLDHDNEATSFCWDIGLRLQHAFTTAKGIDKQLCKLRNSRFSPRQRCASILAAVCLSGRDPSSIMASGRDLGDVSQEESSDDSMARVIQATPQGRHCTTSIVLTGCHRLTRASLLEESQHNQKTGANGRFLIDRNILPNIPCGIADSPRHTDPRPD
jgi:hypothetical protein